MSSGSSDNSAVSGFYYGMVTIYKYVNAEGEKSYGNEL